MPKLLPLFVILFPAFAFAQNWQSLEGPYGQIVTGISVSEDKSVFASSYFEAVFVKRETGAWTRPFSNDQYDGWSFVQVLPDQSILAGRPTLILKSNDKGLNWNPVLGSHSEFGGGNFPHLIRDRDSLFLLYRDYTPSNYCSFMVSSDNGNTWSVRRESVGTFWHGIASDSAGKFVGVGFWGINYSDNHFFTVEDADRLFNKVFNTVASDSLGEVWIATSLDSGVFFSRNRKSWSRPEKGVPDTLWSVAVTPRGIAYVGSAEGVHTSTDGGQTWAEFNQGFPEGLTASYLYVAPDGHLYVGTNGAGIFKTEKPVTGAYAVLPPQLSVEREREQQGVTIDQQYIRIAAGQNAEVEFMDVLGRPVIVSYSEIDGVLAIDRATLNGYLTFAIVTEAGSRRPIKLIAD